MQTGADLPSGGIEWHRPYRAVTPDQSKLQDHIITITHLLKDALIYHLSLLITWLLCLKYLKTLHEDNISHFSKEMRKCFKLKGAGARPLSHVLLQTTCHQQPT